MYKHNSVMVCKRTYCNYVCLYEPNYELSLLWQNTTMSCTYIINALIVNFTCMYRVVQKFDGENSDK